MEIKLFKGIQFKILKAFVGSILISVTLTIFLLFRFLKMIYNVGYSNWGQWSNNHPNKNAVILIVFFLLFVIVTIMFFYIFTRRIINQMKEINENITLISEGNFNIKVPVATKDELGQIASNINVMSNRLEDLLKKERENEKTKNDMISNISHDLRTPLTSVIGYVELMQKLEYKDKEVCDNCIDIILKKCNELRNLVEDLLEYTSISYKGFKLKTESMSIKDLIEQVMVSFIPTLESAGMDFNIKAPNEKIFVNGDISLVVRLFENVINNSIFYGKKGKKINVEIITINNIVSVKIINYGNKIPVEDQPYVFERFYRGDKSRNSNTGGKGMGLAIAKSIVDAHKGSIKVASDDNETSFEILLPSCS